MFYYDETSPTFLRWKVCIGKKIKMQGVAGRISNHGYAQVKFKGKNYQAHRIVLVLNTKEDVPEGFVVDHIDGNKANNSVSNLRVVSQSDNSRNRPHMKSNTGCQAIYECVKTKRFLVQFKDSKPNRIYFSYVCRPKKTTKNHYLTRELAFEAALRYRNTIVEQGLIIITSKEEPNGIN